MDSDQRPNSEFSQFTPKRRKKPLKHWVIAAPVILVLTVVSWLSMGGTSRGSTLEGLRDFFALLSFYTVLALIISKIATVWERRRARKLEKKGLKKQTDASRVVDVTHVLGLGIITGALCHLALSDEGITVGQNNVYYALPFEKIRDIVVKTESEVRTEFKSSIGGAIGGALLFGTPGGAALGSIKVKSDKIVRKYLLIDYDGKTGRRYLVFNCTGVWNANEFVRACKIFPRENRVEIL